jgi:hypothetical protein
MALLAAELRPGSRIMAFPLIKKPQNKNFKVFTTMLLFS